MQKIIRDNSKLSLLPWLELQFTWQSFAKSANPLRLQASIEKKDGDNDNDNRIMIVYQSIVKKDGDNDSLSKQTAIDRLRCLICPLGIQNIVYPSFFISLCDSARI